MTGQLTNIKTDRQQQIVDAVRKIITLKGIEKLTTRSIAGELKISEGALYRHFKNKEEIISFLIDDIERTLFAVIEDVACKYKDPIKKLENIFLSHLSYTEQRKGVTFIVISEVLVINNKKLRRKMFKVINKYLKMIRAVLAGGIKSGKFRNNLDLELASRAFFGMIQVTVTLWVFSGFKASFFKEKDLSRAMDIYEKGIRK